MSNSDREENVGDAGVQAHTAAGPALGYLYQCLCALKLALRLQLDQPDSIIYVEFFDDISVMEAGQLIEVQQVKHSTQAKSLIDTSFDLWKTLFNWINLSRDVIGYHPSLALVTTAAAAENSAAFFLRSDSARNIPLAEERLTAVADSAKPEGNKSYYKAYLALPNEKREVLLDSICVFDFEPNALSMQDELKRQLLMATSRKYVDAFYDRLSGWWLRRIIKALSSKPPEGISIRELELFLNDIRDQFSKSNLPIDYLFDETDESLVQSYQTRVFVRQLKWILLGDPRIRHAITDYYKAFRQRSRWVRESLIVDDELNRYEKRLLDEWQRRFDGAIEDIASIDKLSEEEKIKAGRNLYNWMERHANIPIRQNCTEPYVMRGSYQMLADRIHASGSTRVGWHPDFMSKVIELLALESN